MTADPADSPRGPCPSCGRTVGPDDNFCEACRAELTPAATSGDRTGAVGACPSCPSAQVSADGYCESCGRRVPAQRDHTELDLGLVAGVSDRGLRHHQNEDAMALATAQDANGPVALAVVCDGVSSSSQAAEASLLAAQAAIEVLLAAVRTSADLGEASTAAVQSARAAVAGLPGRPDNAPSATFLSAVLTAEVATLCWLGDSRAYWLGAEPDATAHRLTRDDSLAEEMTAAGLLTEAEALKSPQAHVITRWVGSDLHEAAPHVTQFRPPGPGVLMLCSDGLWNYRPEAAELAALAMPRALTDPLGAALVLLTFALDAGGSDNVTVVLAPFSPSPHFRPPEPPPAQGSVPTGPSEPPTAASH